MHSVPAAGPRRSAFACAGFALFVLIAGTNLPSPLYAVYAQRFGFSPVVLTLIFASYVGTLLPVLLLAGPAADARGHRAVAAAGLCLALAGTLVFAFAAATGWLFLARALQGAAVGLSSGPLTAAMARTEPAGNTRRAALAASAAVAAGGGLGPVIAGVLASWLPAPTRTCYLAEAVALIAAAAGLLALPAGPRAAGNRWQLALPRLPAPVRAPFARACAVSCTGWAVTAVFLSVLPSYVRSLTGNHALSLAGLSAGLILVVAAVIQPAAVRAGARLLQRAGLGVLAAGLAVLLAAGATRSLPLVIAAAVIAGAGQGLAFMGATRQASRLASGSAHAAVISAFYAATYLGVGIPVIGVGLLATATATTTAVGVFAAVALLGAVIVAVLA